MLPTEIFERKSSQTTTELLDQRINDGFGLDVDIFQSSDWPDKHIVGIEGDPVPFHKAQDLGWNSVSRTVALVAGTQSGKTSWGAWWLKREIDQTASPKGKNDYIAVTASYDLFKLKMLPEMIKVFVDILQIGKYWPGLGIIELRDPSSGGFWANRASDEMWGRIILRSAQALGGLESATARAAWLDEAGQDGFPLQAYSAVLRRLSLHQGRILITTTLYNLGWVKSQVVEKAEKGGAKHHYHIGEGEIIHTENENVGISLIQFDSILNPEFSIDEFREREADLDPAEFAMFYRGRVAKLPEMVYDVVDESVLIEDYEIPYDWPVAVGIDPVGAMTAAVYIAYNPEKHRLEIFAEYEEPFGKTTDQHAKDVRDGEGGHRLWKRFGGGPSENQARVDWANAGTAMDPPPFPDMWAQIARVYSLFKSGHLVIHQESCPKLYSALGAMKRKKDANGNLTDTIENKDTFHLPDALRYIIAGLTGSGERIEVQVNYDPVEIR